MHYKNYDETIEGNSIIRFYKISCRERNGWFMPGDKAYYTKDHNDDLIFHREDGPAVELANGTKQWHINGKLHRLDGPAMVTYFGRNEWHIDGVKYTEKAFNQKILDMFL